MNVSLQVRVQEDIPNRRGVEELVRKQAAKLERYCDHISSCRVAVERPQRHQRTGNEYRVRIDLTVPPSHEVVATTEPVEGDLHDPLDTIILRTFKAARRRLQRLAARQRGDVKSHEEPRALVVRLRPEDDYGFLRTPQGREIYFHRNSVLHGAFDRLEIGTEVRFEEEVGEDGPQATTVQIVSKPGARASAEDR